MLRRQVLLPQAPAGDVPPAVRAWTRLLRAHATTARLLSARLQAEHGLTINDYEALYLLARADGQRMRRVDLAGMLVLTPSGVTRLLEGLEQRRLVRKAACESDLRVTYAELTDEGRERLDAASCGHVGSVRALFEEHLTEDEIETLGDLLGKLPGVTGGDACAAA